MSTSKPPRGLGRGLDVLLPAKPTQPARVTNESANVFTCPIDKIVPSKSQPRQHFDTKALDELAQSIREHGVIEPLVVRRQPGSDAFELVAGERRWRAAQRAGLRDVLVIVREVSAREAYELALIENVQREDLNAIEFAEALDRLISEHNYLQETLADRLGKDRSTIANALRLLKLPEKVRSLVTRGELTEGHARALLGAADSDAILRLAEKVVQGRMSVRQTEALVRALRSAKPAAERGANGTRKSPSVRDLESRLERRLGTKCEVRDRNGKGEIVVRYSSWDELDRLLETLL